MILKQSFFTKQGKTIKTKVQILLGRILFKGTESNNSEFEIDTPGVFCGVRGTEFQTEYTKDGVSRVSVFEGKVQASAGGQDVNISAGCGSQIVKGESPSPPKPLPKTPELIEPVNGYLTGILTPTFGWKSVPEAASYHFELSKDEAFNDVVYKVRGTVATGIVAPTLQVGRYYWHVSSIDEVGLEGKFSDVRILKVVRKLQMEVVPTIPLYEKDRVLYTSPFCKYTLNPSDVDTSIARMMVAVDNEDFYMHHGQISLEKAGTHTIKYKGVDASGNYGEINKFVVVVDNTPPEIKIAIDRCVQLKSGCFVQSQAGFSLVAVDTASGVAEVLYKIAEGPLPDNGEWKRYSGTFSILAEGSHRIGFRAKDNVGNQSKEKMLDVIVDKTPPEIKIDIDRKSGSFVHPQTGFSLIAADTASGVDEVLCRIDDEGWQRYKGVFSISQAGSHQIGFRAKDNVGNQSQEQVLKVIVDNTPPEIKIELDRKSGSFVHPQTGFSLIAIDSASGVNEVLYRIDKEEWKRYSGAFSILEEGIHQIGFRTRDMVGNQSKEKVIDVIVDNTPPKVVLVTDKDEVVEDGCSVLPWCRFKLKANDDGVGIDKLYFSVDGSKLTEYSKPFSLSDKEIHHISFQAADLLGNRSDIEVFKLVVKRKLPEKKW